MEKIYKGEIQRLMPIFQAMAEGRTIQFSANGNSWTDIDGDEEGLFLDPLIATPTKIPHQARVYLPPIQECRRVLAGNGKASAVWVDERQKW